MPTINYDLDFNIKKEVFTDFQIQNKLVVESNFDFETTYELIICQDDKFPIDFSITNIEDSQANIEKDHMIEWEDQDNETTSVEKYQIYLGFNEETIELVGETSNLFYLISGNLNTDYICYIRQITYCGYKDTPAIRYKTQKYDVSPDISLISPELDSLTHSSIILMWSQQRQEYFKIYFSQVSSITEDDLIEDYEELDKAEIVDLIDDTSPFTFAMQFASPQRVTELSAADDEIEEAIVEKDGLFTIPREIKQKEVPIDKDFMSLVDSVLK